MDRKESGVTMGCSHKGPKKKIITRNKRGKILAVRYEFPRWKLIIFHKGKKHIKFYWDPKEAQEIQKQLEEKGVKSHVVCRRFPKFPPKGEPEDPDQLWCPYCRRWRFFAVPKGRDPFTSLEIRCCRWCDISEDDSQVKNYNGTWQGRANRKRRRKRRRSAVR